MTTAITEISPNSLFSPDENVLGKDYNYWILQYWNTFGVPKKEKLKHKVFCMSASIENDFKFDIPQNRGILISPIKYIAMTEDAKLEKNKKMMEERCKWEIDIIEDLNLLIDGQLLSPYINRIRSPYFTPKQDPGFTALCEGYWLILKPRSLEKGTHHISSFSSCKAGKVQIPAEYDITII
jgi:hypothetical protein